jgi:hypothetical protein
MIWAFASVVRHARTPAAVLWLTGWLMMLVHSIAALFTHVPGLWGGLTFILYSSALVWAGMLFTYASIPYRNKSLRWSR